MEKSCFDGVKRIYLLKTSACIHLRDNIVFIIIIVRLQGKGYSRAHYKLLVVNAKRQTHKR